MVAAAGPEHKLAAAFGRLLARVRRATLDRLRASARELQTMEWVKASLAAEAAGEEQPHPIFVVRPEALFDAEEWAALTRGELADVLGEIVVDAANGTRAGYAFDVTDPRMAAAVGRHVDAIASWGQELRGTVTNIVEAGVRDGWSVERIAAKLTSSGPLSASRARLIARTEAVAASNAGTVEGWRASGVVAEKQWLATSSDGRTRDSHRAANGQRVPLDGLFQVGAGTGEYPGDPRLPAAERAGCRCTCLSVEAEEPPIPKVATVTASAGGPKLRAVARLALGSARRRLPPLGARLGFRSGTMPELVAGHVGCDRHNVTLCPGCSRAHLARYDQPSPAAPNGTVTLATDLLAGRLDGIRPSAGLLDDLVAHELVHHALHRRTGDPDSGHGRRFAAAAGRLGARLDLPPPGAPVDRWTMGTAWYFAHDRTLRVLDRRQLEGWPMNTRPAGHYPGVDHDRWLAG